MPAGALRPPGKSEFRLQTPDFQPNCPFRPAYRTAFISYDTNRHRACHPGERREPCRRMNASVTGRKYLRGTRSEPGQQFARDSMGNGISKLDGNLLELGIFQLVDVDKSSLVQVQT